MFLSSCPWLTRETSLEVTWIQALSRANTAGKIDVTKVPEPGRGEAPGDPIPRERFCLCGHRETSSHCLWKPHPCIQCACKAFRYVVPGDKRLRPKSGVRIVE